MEEKKIIDVDGVEIEENEVKENKLKTSVVKMKDGTKKYWKPVLAGAVGGCILLATIVGKINSKTSDNFDDLNDVSDDEI